MSQTKKAFGMVGKRQKISSVFEGGAEVRMRHLVEPKLLYAN